MTRVEIPDPRRFVDAIRKSGLSIYHPIEIGDPDLWIPTPDLEALLDEALRGISVAHPPKTRSKIVRERVCKALGYPVPKSFKRSQPKFPGQFFDTYVQKRNNLQVWNQELAPTRRYVLIRPDPNDVICRVKVVTGDTLALLDTTGTLTQKYQARCISGKKQAELISPFDTEILLPLVSETVDLKQNATPVGQPQAQQILSIATIFDRLKKLVGVQFRDPGHDQDRNRGAALHRLASEALGYSDYRDDGQFPDIRHQLLEVKLQTAPTIDLGLVTPASKEPLDVPKINSRQIRHCDVRYALFCAQTDGKFVTLTHAILTTGAAFFSRFPQFGGKVLNKKLQIPLPADFFDR